MSSPKPEQSHGYLKILRQTWPLLIYDSLVGIFISADYINLIFLSNMLWPGEPFHALQMGALITIRLWVDGVCALFWGHFVDRVRRKNLWAFTSSFTGIMIFINGLLPVGGGNAHYIYWAFFRGLTGMFMSAGGPSNASLVSDILPKEERSRYFGLSSMVWGFVPSLFSLCSAFIFQLGYWRYYYMAVGILYIAYGLGMKLFFTEPKRGIREHALQQVLKNEDVEYKFTLSKDTIKTTIFSKTNILIFAEGISTNIFFGILDLVLLPYLQDSPRNLSATNSAVLSLTFGLPGAIIGPIVFGKIADKLAKRNIKNRIGMILISLVGGFALVSCFFFIQLPHLTSIEGSQTGIIWQYPGFMVYGVVIMLARIDFSLFSVNQPPLIQEINLPEAQGTIRSWGQMVEIASYGFGPLLAGYLLTQFQNDYQAVILRMAWLLLPGIIMWILSLKTITKDRHNIQNLLKERSSILEKNRSPNEGEIE